MINSSKYIISEFFEFKTNEKLIKEAEERGKPLIMTGILQRADTVNRNGRIYPYNILKREVEKYMELVESNTAGGECVPAGTEIYTSNGWKNIEDTKVGESIYTINLETDKLEIQNINSTISKPYNDDIIRIYNNSNLDFMVTKKHKIVLWDRNDKSYVLTAEELFEKLSNSDSKVAHSYIKHSSKWDGNHIEHFTIPDSDIKINSKDWAAFLGIFISEGHCSGTRGGKNRNETTITQTKEYSKKLIIELLDKLPFNYTIRGDRQFVIKNEKLYNHLVVLGNSYEKYIPDYAKEWSTDLISILFDWLLIGDGKNRKKNNGELIKEYYTTSKRLSEDVYNIILKLGNGATITTHKQKDRFIYDIKEITKEIDLDNGTIELVKEKIKIKRLIKEEDSKQLFVIHSRESKGIYLDSRYVKFEKIPFNANVYCVSVKNKTWLMRYNNKVCWTHNCDHPDSAVVSLANVSHRVIDMWWQGKDLYGKVLIAEDTIAGKNLKGLLKAGFTLGISSRGVGSVKSQGGNDIVQEDFELIAFDFVSSPSTPGAYLFKEGKEVFTRGMVPLKNEHYKLLLPESQDLKEQTEYYSKLNNLINKDFWKNL